MATDHGFVPSFEILNQKYHEPIDCVRLLFLAAADPKDHASGVAPRAPRR